MVVEVVARRACPLGEAMLAIRSVTPAVATVVRVGRKSPAVPVATGRTTVETARPVRVVVVLVAFVRAVAEAAVSTVVVVVPVVGSSPMVVAAAEARPAATRTWSRSCRRRRSGPGLLRAGSRCPGSIAIVWLPTFGGTLCGLSCPAD